LLSSTQVQILAQKLQQHEKDAWRRTEEARAAEEEACFTCFASTKVQILTQKLQRHEEEGRLRAEEAYAADLLRQYLYFCTSKASKLST
jgi:hypothetical protein